MPRKTKRTNEIDKRIGENVKHQRLAKGYSRHELSGLIGVTHQQLAKYEKGSNRMSAGRLFTIAESLAMPIGHFYNTEPPIKEDITYRSRLCLEVSRNFIKIKALAQQEAINRLIYRMAEDK